VGFSPYNNFFFQQIIEGWTESSGIGQLFLTFAPFLKMYNLYTANFEKAVTLIDEWTRKTPAFAAALKECYVSFVGFFLS
jgi:hypothetical protein